MKTMNFPMDFVTYYKSGVIKSIATVKNEAHLIFILAYARSEKARWALIRHSDGLIMMQSKHAQVTSRLARTALSEQP